MKKTIALLLTMLLLVSLMPTVVFGGEEINKDIFKFNDSFFATSENGCFTLSTRGTYDGWYGGAYFLPLSIHAINGLTITDIEAVIVHYGDRYENVGVSSGAKQQNSGVSDGSTVTVSGINAPEFSFADGTDVVVFSEITVYYTGSHIHNFDSKGKCECGKNKCEVEGHSYENGVCTLCGYKCPHGTWNEGFCADCGYKCPHGAWNECICTVCGIECPHDAWHEGSCAACGYKCPHDAWNKGFCAVCGLECPHEEHAKTVVTAEKEYCPDCGEALSLTEITAPESTGSTLSEGNLVIIVAIAGVAVGMTVMFFIMKKKKSVPADDAEEENNDEE